MPSHADKLPSSVTSPPPGARALSTVHPSQHPTYSSPRSLTLTSPMGIPLRRVCRVTGGWLPCPRELEWGDSEVREEKFSVFWALALHERGTLQQRFRESALPSETRCRLRLCPSFSLWAWPHHLSFQAFLSSVTLCYWCLTSRVVRTKWDNVILSPYDLIRSRYYFGFPWWLSW